MQYRIFPIDGEWKVYSVYNHYGELVKEENVFSSNSFADCYAWIKAKEEGLIGK